MLVAEHGVVGEVIAVARGAPRAGVGGIPVVGIGGDCHVDGAARTRFGGSAGGLRAGGRRPGPRSSPAGTQGEYRATRPGSANEAAPPDSAPPIPGAIDVLRTHHANPPPIDGPMNKGHSRFWRPAVSA